MKRRLMAEQWDQFARAVLPKRCPDIQRKEMRRAFYAGAQAIMFGVIANLAPDHEPTQEDLDMMTELQNELNEFAQLVKEGRA